MWQQQMDQVMVSQGDELELGGLIDAIKVGNVTLKNKTNGAEIALTCDFSERQIDMLLAGGLLKYTAQK